jgi:hypothetical protein
MRKIVCQRIFIILIYVDNLLLLMDHREAKRMEMVLTREFKWIVMSIGSVQSYLGMQITLEEKQVTVDMIYFLEQVLQPYTSLKSYLTPGTTMFFAVDNNIALLPTKDRKQFHTTTAKLLYLAKRSHPDLLTTTSFLCTRVKAPTQQDNNKLQRVLGYLK